MKTLYGIKEDFALNFWWVCGWQESLVHDTLMATHCCTPPWLSFIFYEQVLCVIILDGEEGNGTDSENTICVECVVAGI